MELTALTPLGLLRCSGEDSPALAIYRSQLAAIGDAQAFDISEGSRMEAVCFARAIGFARMQEHLEQAARERLPTEMYWNVPTRERELGILPAASATFAERIDAIQERSLLPRGGSEFEIVESLTSLLGDDFVAYRPTPIDNAVIAPAACGDHPMNLQRPDVGRKLCRLASAVSFIGVPQTVGFEMVNGVTLEVGDVVVFTPGGWGVADRITITAIGGTAEVPTLTATFTYTHDAGAWGTTMPYPEWSSSKRHSLIVLGASAAADPERRRIVNEQIQRISGAVSTWDVVEATGDESATSAFMLDEPSLDRRTLQTVTL